MHPAPSVIIFTSLSGLGFGLLFFLGLGVPDVTGVVAFVFFAIAYGLSVGGLLASTFHLGHPERAAKAFRQWRSSWLSREGWAAVVTLGVMAVYAMGRVFWGFELRIVGIVGAIGALATVWTTAMIYAQLKSIPRWHTWLTPAYFMSLSLAGGALLSGEVQIAVVLLIVAGAVQLITWQRGDSAFKEAGTTLATATGLGHMGTPRAFEPPHSGQNYLLSEFVFVVGRKHAAKLRMISLGLMVGMPVIFLALPFNHIFAALAVLSHIAGVFASRWLFFAQAEHVVGLYYGKR